MRAQGGNHLKASTKTFSEELALGGAAREFARGLMLC